ncbi:MAG: hypothetical protein AABX01_01500 [Candidatus Micrarchaeota archaeon]|mgnify:CR=1 FL=1
MVAIRKDLKGPEEVEWLKITHSKALGSGEFGTVFPGKIKFIGGKSFKVAIKVFHGPLSDSHAHKYQTTIDDLRKADVPMVRMGMYKLKDRWVQVFDKYSRGNKSVITPVFQSLPSVPLIKQYLIACARIVNAGKPPIGDALSELPPRISPRIKVRDIDSLTPMATGRMDEFELAHHAYLAFPVFQSSDNLSQSQMNDFVNFYLGQIKSDLIRSEVKKRLERKGFTF